ncbi:MAG: lytic transglycosylase domain-containing protein [Cyanobacteriota bacterium]|nr:lytic transglycosylase domain-containing protein [Cyanobacteriota bacterium]
MARLSVLLAVSCLGTGGALLAGRALLGQKPALTPDSSTAQLERAWRWSPDPVRRRDAALLLASRGGERGPAGGGGWLAAQGWGREPLAAVVLKQAALRRETLTGRTAALPLWRQLLRRFPGEPASADALYALGRRQPTLRQELLRRFPAHPGALAAALEAGPGAAERQAGTLHLARWGARWPGATEAITALCDHRALSPSSQALLVRGLVEAGDGPGALRCLRGQGRAQEGLGAHEQGAILAALDAPGRLAVARALLKGTPEDQQRGVALLVALVRQRTDGAEAEEAVRLLSEREGVDTPALLNTLPPRWRDSAPVQARLASGEPTGRSALAVLKRWPRDPASWDLQWEVTRRRLLEGNWEGAVTLLDAIPAELLPPVLAARHRFWMGYAQQQLGQDEEATLTWKQLLLHHPGGYYGWRASARLGKEDLWVRNAPPSTSQKTTTGWQPLASGDGFLDELWRLGQTTEAWEVWRVRRDGQPPEDSPSLLVEGRLRQGVGDDWTGLGQLERAALRLKPEQCALLPQLESSLHPHRHLDALAPAAERWRVALPLLLGVAKQESRFTPAVQSPAGAVGLLQLMPATASELAGSTLSTTDLQDPKRNASLGALYLRNLLEQWQGDPLAAVASYNAGPGAVEGWRTPDRKTVPELWVEAIPFPETRLYVKKVLGNAWSFQRQRQPAC